RAAATACDTSPQRKITDARHQAYSSRSLPHGGCADRGALARLAAQFPSREHSYRDTFMPCRDPPCRDASREAVSAVSCRAKTRLISSDPEPPGHAVSRLVCRVMSYAAFPDRPRDALTNRVMLRCRHRLPVCGTRPAHLVRFLFT